MEELDGGFFCNTAYDQVLKPPPSSTWMMLPTMSSVPKNFTAVFCDNTMEFGLARACAALPCKGERET